MWDYGKALASKRARTRDGRDVFDLREAVLDGERVLIGAMATIKVRQYKKDSGIPIESVYWPLAGWGRHGGDDLVNLPERRKS